MNDNLQSGFQLGEWEVYPKQNLLKGTDRSRHLEPKIMDVLVYLAARQGNVISHQQILNSVWAGTVVGKETLSRAISVLRTELGDDPKNPKYLETISKRGYRLIAEVHLQESIKKQDPDKLSATIRNPSITRPELRRNPYWIAGVALSLSLVVAIFSSIDGPSNEPASEGISSVAVLPFVNLTGDPAREYFADGLTETLITELSRISELRVTSRQSVMQLKDTNLLLPDIARMLNVDFVLQASTQHAGDRVRISANLVDSGTEKSVWADVYERELTTSNIFAIQSDIAWAIADVMRATLLPRENARIGYVPTQSMAALDSYFHGRQELAKRNTHALTQSIEYFQKAIDIDPEFALAYVGLADSYYVQKNYAGSPKFESHVKARNAIDRALELDDQLGEAYATLGVLKADMYEFDTAELAFKKAINLNPNYATTYLWYSWMLGQLGRHEEALELQRRGAELDPQSAIMNAGSGARLVTAGQPDEALVKYRKTIAKSPEFAPAYHGIAFYHRLVSGQIDQAVIWAKKGISIDPDHVEYLFEIGADYLHLGDPEAAEYWFNRAIRQSPAGFYANMGMQVLHASRGDDVAGMEFGLKTIAVEPRVSFPVRYLRDIELRAGRYQKARDLYQRCFPELLASDEPKLDGENIRAAIDVAVVLNHTGEYARANSLLESSLQYLQTTSSEFRDYNVLTDVQIYALQGRTQDALSALRRAVDQNWRFYWWYYLKLDWALNSIRGEPEFQTILKELEADMAEQLARLRSYESLATVAAEF